MSYSPPNPYAHYPPFPPGAAADPSADPTSLHHQQQQQAFASSAALGLAQMSAAASSSSGSQHNSVEPTGAGGGSAGAGGSAGGSKGKDKDESVGPGGEEKKKQTRGARACTVCRKLKMRCVGAEEGPPCKRCKNGGHECIFEESQRGRRSNRKTDAMAKSLKSMEAKLESVLASISNPGLLAGSGGLVTDPSQRLPYAPLDSGPGGAEGRGDVLVGTNPAQLDPQQVATALELVRASQGAAAASVAAQAADAALSGLAHGAAGGGGGGKAGKPPALPRADSNSAIIRKDPITLPPIAPDARFEVGGGVSSHAEIGPSRTGGHPALHHFPYPSTQHHHQHAHPHGHHVHFGPGAVYSPTGSGPAQLSGVGRSSAAGSSSKSSPMEWSGVKDPAAADGSPRLHSLPDNTLNPLGLLAEASLRNTRKRPMDISAEVYDVTGDLHHPSDDDEGEGGKGGKKGKRAKGRKAVSGGAEGAEEEDGEEDGPAGKKRKTGEGAAEAVGNGKGKGKGKDGAATAGSQKKPLGMANRNYFAPGPMNILPLRRIVIEQRMPPALLEEKILSVEEVVELFALFFEHCARHCPFLDPEIHTPAATGSRSPFLFTCICTVAARYYTKRTDDLYRKCLRVAKRVAFDVMTKGYKSTEICQGFLLLCNWNQPAERFEEERTYQFSGIAIRMATDLNLHRKTIAQLPPDIGDETRVLYERELLNRERTWLYTFICDRSVSTQMGKPYAISREDYLVRNAANWHRAPGAPPSDSGLSAMVELQRVVGRMLDVLYSDTRSVSGLNAHLDYPMLIRAFLQQLDQWRRDWSDLESVAPDADEFNLKARAISRDFYWSYYRLFLLSFAVQHALEDPSSSIDLPSYCVLCFESAERMIIILRDFLGPQGVLRYAIDSTFVYASYAATFLLKLVSPTFASFIDEEAAMKLVKETAEVLEAAAVDEQHTPALYASFLRMLIENKLNGPRTAANSRAPTRPGSPIAGQSSLNGTLGSALGSHPAFAPSSDGLTAPYYLNGAGSTPSFATDAFLKSRAPSVGPEGYTPGYSGTNGFGTPGPGGGSAFQFDPTLGGAFPGGLGEATQFNPLGGEFNAGGDGGPAFDSMMVDDVLSANGFWSSMLMPGFGGPLAGLSGGSGAVFGNPADPFSATPFHSRPPSPSQLAQSAMQRLNSDGAAAANEQKEEEKAPVAALEADGAAAVGAGPAGDGVEEDEQPTPAALDARRPSAAESVGDGAVPAEEESELAAAAAQADEGEKAE